MRRVLVIDDHQSSRRHLVAILNSGGYEVTGAYSMGFWRQLHARIGCKYFRRVHRTYCREIV